ncbi:MAG: hypothetical protein ABJC61_08235, partial [Acidobacteriota bacterium]
SARITASVWILALSCRGVASGAPPRAVSEEFFIVSSVDAGRGTMVLKRPTEVTLTMRFTAQTRCRSEAGKPTRPSDLKAGDTVFIASAAGPDGPVASTVREGIMTVPELQRRYLGRGGADPSAGSR